MEQGWIGLDESGKGDYFGPLVVAGVAVTPPLAEQLTAWGVRDSKRISDGRIEQLDVMIRRACPFEVIAIGPEKYNELYEKFKNLNHLLAWAHARTLENLLERAACLRAIADQFGDARLIERALMQRGRTIRLEQRHRAEADPAVAAASIVARAEFVHRLARLGSEIGCTLPKGASKQVEAAARALVAEHGSDVLGRVAKLHFRTTQSVVAR